jgi:outer membrane protein assembly factor BamB
MLGGTPQRNMVNTVDRNLPTEWSIGDKKNIKWAAQLGTKTYTSPVIAGGKVFIGTNNHKPRDPKVKGDKAILMCFRESDGQFLWQIAHDMPPADIVREARSDGLPSNPVVDVDRSFLYYVTPGCEVVCADLDGKVVWSRDLVKQLKVFPCYMCTCSPLIVGDLLFVTTGNGRDAENMLPEPAAPSLVALNKKTGEVKWQDNSPGQNILEGQWANPVYAEVNGKGQIICPGGDGWLRGLDPETGKLIWKFDCNPKKAVFKPGGRGTRNYLIATPVVYDNKVYVGVGQNPEHGAGVGHLWCVDITRTGDLSPVNDKFDPKDPGNKNSGLVWHFGGEAANAVRDFSFGRTMSACAVHDGLVYAADLDGFVYCLDAKTGQVYWDHDLKSGIWGSPYWVDKKIYIGNDDGDVYIFAHGKEKKLIGQPIAMEIPIKTGLVAANGVLYVTTESKLFAMASK